MPRANLDKILGNSGLELIKRGKVRDLYRLDKEKILIVTTGRISIFDLVLSAEVLYKDEILNALSIFWIKTLNLLGDHNIRAYGDGIDIWLPLVDLSANKELQKTAIVVQDQEPLKIEIIVRGYITGSAWKSYEKDGSVYGYKPGPGLHDGSKLPEPIITPTTKADSGHDEPISYERAVEICGEDALKQCLTLYKEASEFAFKKGIIIADTKFEVSKHGFIDEILTPDSSRFWLIKEWQDAAQKGEAPQGYDKEPVRQWGKTVKTPWGIGINKLNPENPKHLDLVNNRVKVPDEVIKDTTRRYREIFLRLTGMELEEFQKSVMGIS